MEEMRGGRPSSHAPIRAERSALTARRSRWSNLVDWYVAVGHCHAISHNVNTVPLQCAPNLFNLLLIHTTNANATGDLAVTILHNFELK